MTNRSDIRLLEKSYERLPYLSQAYTQSHPNRLATLAHLFQIQPVPITRCRVLELGCAAGGNIIPLAWHLPESEFVGIEMAPGQAKTGQQTVSGLGIENLRIREANILEVDDSLGSFDYIICHGVFSWVPREVQDKILRIAGELLNPRGVAYISYNTYPGWHVKEMIRNMMLYHAGHFDSLEQQLGQARATINFLADAVEMDGDRTYALALKKELQILRNADDWYLFHDYLEVVNEPVYFHQFCGRAEAYGLQYLAEAEFGAMFSDDFSPQTNATLEEISQDIIQKEQYMDFLRNRPFRQTLLCHQGVEINRYLDADGLQNLLIASQARPEREDVDLSPQVAEKFTIQEGVFIETRSPELKTALLVLNRHWPRAVAFDTLLEETVSYLRKVFAPEIQRQTVRKELGRELLQCYISRGVQLTTWQNTFCDRISDRPQVSKLTLYQVGQGPYIVSPDHEKISLDHMSRQIVRLLDGDHDRESILERMDAMVGDGYLQVTRHGMPVTDRPKIRLMIEDKFETVMSVLRKSRLLVA